MPHLSFPLKEIGTQADLAHRLGVDVRAVDLISPLSTPCSSAGVPSAETGERWSLPRWKAAGGLPLVEFEDGGLGGDGFGRGGRQSRGRPHVRHEDGVSVDTVATGCAYMVTAMSGTRTDGGKGLGRGEWQLHGHPLVIY